MNINNEINLNNEVECCICFSKLNNDDINYICNKNLLNIHGVCQFCFNNYVKRTYLGGYLNQNEVKCPSCYCIIDDNNLKNMLTDELYDKLKTKYNEIDILRDNKRCFCPSKYCNAVVNINQSYFTTNSKCSICQYEFCHKCMGKSHPYGLCWLGTENKMKFFVLNKNIKQCPKCQRYIEKNLGCPHMTCSAGGCGYQFCWICKTEWSKHSQNKLYCNIMNITCHPLWGPNIYVRFITKSIAYPLTIATLLTGGALALVAGSIGITLSIPYYMTLKIYDNYKLKRTNKKLRTIINHSKDIILISINNSINFNINKLNQQGRELNKNELILNNNNYINGYLYYCKNKLIWHYHINIQNYNEEIENILLLLKHNLTNKINIFILNNCYDNQIDINNNININNDYNNMNNYNEIKDDDDDDIKNNEFIDINRLTYNKKSIQMKELISQNVFYYHEYLCYEPMLNINDNNFFNLINDMNDLYISNNSIISKK